MSNVTCVTERMNKQTKPNQTKEASGCNTIRITLNVKHFNIDCNPLYEKLKSLNSPIVLMISNSSSPLSFSPSESLASTAAGGSLGRLPWRRLATLEDAITTEKKNNETNKTQKNSNSGRSYLCTASWFLSVECYHKFRIKWPL